MKPQQDEQQPIIALHEGLPSASLPSRISRHDAAKIYHGRIGPDGNAEVWVCDFPRGKTAPEGQMTTRPLPLHLELRNHSPTGFAWGYGGSGPAQLALALLMDATGDRTLALRHYQEFKFEFVAKWDDSWHITQDEINSFITARENPAGCLAPRNSCPGC